MPVAHIHATALVDPRAKLAGHVVVGPWGIVQVDDRAYLGGASAVHQFCRIGRLAMIGGLAKITQDVPPFIMAEGAGTCSQVVGLNKVGLRRNGYTPQQILQLKNAYRVIYRE